MLRQIHSLPGLLAGLLVVVMAVTGAVLSLDPAIERAGAVVPPVGTRNVAALAEAAVAGHAEVDRIVRAASGSVIVYYFHAGRAAADVIDPVTGEVIGPFAPSGFTRIVTNLHRSLLLGDAGRAAVGVGALAMVVLSVSGGMMLAARLGGWRAVLRPVRGTAIQRVHTELARFAVIGLLLSGLTGCYMSLATFGVLSDGMAADAATPASVNGGPRLPVGTVQALQAVDVNDFRELTFPYANDLTDVYSLTTAQAISHIDAATGVTLTHEPHTTARRIYEVVYWLHTGRGVWPLALVLGLAALMVPVLAGSGGLIWWRRRGARPNIRDNVGANVADTIILVGSEGNATWGFASTLHAALTQAGHKVHAAPMNLLAPSYARAERMVIMTSTYGDGTAPASATCFLSRLSRTTSRVPVAVLGFGDRCFPRFCQFADDVTAALANNDWPELLATRRVDRQSVQDLAQWGTDLGAAMGCPLVLSHVPVRPRTIPLELLERIDYGMEVQAPTAILRFRAQGARTAWSRLFGARLPRFEVGDLVGILAPNTDLPRFYSLASSSSDGVLEICVRKQAGGVCSGFLQALAPGATVEVFIRPNPAFRPNHESTPLILIGAGAGIGPLAGIIRHNRGLRPVHLYWGGRDPASDFLYEEELTNYLADSRLTRLKTVFSRVPGGCYVQERIAKDAAELRDLLRDGAQVMVCGGRGMAVGVARALGAVVEPLGMNLATLRSSGRYLEDVY